MGDTLIRLGCEGQMIRETYKVSEQCKEIMGTGESEAQKLRSRGNEGYS